MIKVVFTGPESSGKTTASLWVSKQCDFRYVAEMARLYMEDLSDPYTEDDVRAIGKLQWLEEKTVENQQRDMVCDTDLLTIMVWQLEKYGQYDEGFYHQWISSSVDMYFLCSSDVEWVPDPLREHPHDRDRLFMIYHDLLIQSGKPYVIIAGAERERQDHILKVIERLRERSILDLT